MEIFGLRWSDVMYDEGLLAVRAKLKGGKMRYVPMPPELAVEIRRHPAVIGEDLILTKSFRMWWPETPPAFSEPPSSGTKWSWNQRI